MLLKKELSDCRHMTETVGSDRDTVHDLDTVVANLPLLMLLGGLFYTLLTIAAAVGVLVLLSSALFSFPELVLGETTYESGWVLVRFGPLLVLHGGLAGVAACGIWMEKRWSRGLVVAFWISAIASTSLAAILHPVGGRFWFTVALGCLPILVSSWLYLYFWGGVAAYYDGLC